MNKESSSWLGDCVAFILTRLTERPNINDSI